MVRGLREEGIVEGERSKREVLGKGRWVKVKRGGGEESVEEGKVRGEKRSLEGK